MGRKNVIIDREVQKWSLLTPEQNKEVRIMNKKIFCTKLFSNNAEETYKKLFSQFDFTRTKEITPGIMDVLSLYIYDFLSGDMTVSEMYTNLFENME